MERHPSVEKQNATLVHLRALGGVAVVRVARPGTHFQRFS